MMKSDDPYKNVIYLGRSKGDCARHFYYVGQAALPSRRWDQHCRNGTGPWLFGSDVQWALLVWNVPGDKLDSAESYLIGYVLAKFGCVNGNRGMDERAFRSGYQDAVNGKAPAICSSIDLDRLDWQDFHYVTEDVVADNRIIPTEGGDILSRPWGFSFS